MGSPSHSLPQKLNSVQQAAAEKIRVAVSGILGELEISSEGVLYYEIFLCSLHTLINLVKDSDIESETMNKVSQLFSTSRLNSSDEILQKYYSDALSLCYNRIEALENDSNSEYLLELHKNLESLLKIKLPRAIN